jgi:hypothetical protein
MLQERTVFLTWDGPILRLRDMLQDRFGIRVQSPDDFLAEVEYELTASAPPPVSVRRLARVNADLPVWRAASLHPGTVALRSRYAAEEERQERCSALRASG